MAKKSNSYAPNKPLLPMVSVCTPTFNRRPFIPMMLECFRNQTYPKSRIEWIIIDDGTDKIGDLIDAANIPQIKYFTVDKKMTLGAKRNMLHDKSRGSILVYMDDDDYYPPERVSHAVETLMRNPQAMCAGASEIYLYFKNIKTTLKNPMFQFGPYGPNHATAATFAFRRELLNQTRYETNTSIAEERFFLKEYTIPFVQLDPLKTILVFSHEHNSFDKRTLLDNANPQYTKPSNKTVDMFIRMPKEAKIKKFFMEDIDKLLLNYSPGEPRMKPDVVKQIQDLKVQREQQAKEMAEKSGETQIMMVQPGKDPVPIGINDTVNIINQQQQHIRELMTRIELLEANQISTPKNVSFSEPIIAPSAFVQEKHNAEKNTLENKIKQLESENKMLSIKNAELTANYEEIIRKNNVNTSHAKSQPSQGWNEAANNPFSYTNNLLKNPVKPKSKSDPEIQIILL